MGCLKDGIKDVRTFGKFSMFSLICMFSKFCMLAVKNHELLSSVPGEKKPIPQGLTSIQESCMKDKSRSTPWLFGDFVELRFLF